MKIRMIRMIRMVRFPHPGLCGHPGHPTHPGLGWEICKLGLAIGVVICSLAGSLAMVASVESRQGAGFAVAGLCLGLAFISGLAIGVAEAEKIKAVLKDRFANVRRRTETG